MATEYRIVDAQEEDLPLVLALNQSEVPHVGHLTSESLRGLIREAVYFRKAVDVMGRSPSPAEGGASLAGFVIGFDENAAYQSENYQWFKRNYKNFLYIDRVAVAKAFRRSGVGRLLYEDVEREAVARGCEWVTCEVNVNPPNPDSLAYHIALGFKPVGEQDTEGGSKRVCLMAKRVHA